MPGGVFRVIHTHDAVAPPKQTHAGGGSKFESLQRCELGFCVPEFFVGPGGVDDSASIHPGPGVAPAQRLEQAMACVCVAVNQAGKYRFSVGINHLSCQVPFLQIGR